MKFDRHSLGDREMEWFKESGLRERERDVENRNSFHFLKEKKERYVKRRKRCQLILSGIN